MFKSIVMSGVVFGCLSAPAMAQTAAAGGAPMTASDFITAASQSDMFEIEEGKMAQKMGSTAAVRQFGSKMVRDHVWTAPTVQVKCDAARSVCSHVSGL